MLVGKERPARFLYATARLLNVPLLSIDRLLHGYAEADRTVTVVW